ncbi:hypothetical protein D3C81_10690 [compost metagenome]
MNFTEVRATDIKSIQLKREVNDLNRLYFTIFPQDKGFKWSGCDVHINDGKSEAEPLGTGHALYTCSNCPDFKTCNLKQDKPFWVLDENSIKK